MTCVLEPRFFSNARQTYGFDAAGNAQAHSAADRVRAGDDH